MWRNRDVCVMAWVKLPGDKTTGGLGDVAGDCLLGKGGVVCPEEAVMLVVVRRHRDPQPLPCVEERCREVLQT